MLKKFALPLAIFYSLALTILSLIQIKNIPNVGFSISDKTLHFLAYAILTLLWYNTFLSKFKVQKNKAISYASVLSVVFGIIIEVLQGSVTTVRQPDISDAIANTLGVLLVAIVLLINNRKQVKN